MFSIAFMVFAIRQVLPDREWRRVENYIRVSFWGLNIGLAGMVVLNLLPGGVLQLFDVLKNGYWHARGPEFLNDRTTTLIEWIRLPADAIFIVFGVVPLLISTGFTYRFVRKSNRGS
jgi:nitric oxide reductase subunit B